MIVQLIPFFPRPAESLEVTVSVVRDDCSLALSFHIQGDVSSLSIPETVAVPARCDGLWRATCCECFFKQEGNDAYYEANVSPGGNWNLYSFRSYRAGMQEAGGEGAIRSETVIGKREVVLSCRVCLAGLAITGNALTVGVSCVFGHTDGTKSYWALSHPGREPDFHHPGAFGLRL